MSAANSWHGQDARFGCGQPDRLAGSLRLCGRGSEVTAADCVAGRGAEAAGWALFGAERNWNRPRWYCDQRWRSSCCIVHRAGGYCYIGNRHCCSRRLVLIFPTKCQVQVDMCSSSM